MANDELAVSKGLKMLESVFGAEEKNTIAGMLSTPVINETVTHLLGEIWSRPQLSVRDRRLLVIGLSATLADANTIRALVTGALINDELNDEQLDEILLFLPFYTGWGKGGSLIKGVELARNAVKEQKI